MDHILQSFIYKHMTFIKGKMQSIKQSLQTICIFDLPFVKLMKGKALRKHSLHEKTAASVLLKLFISGNK